jgi:AcrR family transcriptional regulator
VNPGTTSLSPRAGEILDVARSILEEEGREAMTMREIGHRMGIRAPSLYKHFPDKRSIEVGLISVGFEEWADVIGRASSRRHPLAAIARAYRRYALDHPHLYRLMTTEPLPRADLPPGLENKAAAPLLTAAGSLPRARAIWGLAHGLVMLELNGRFPEGADIDAAWRAGLRAFSA